MVKFNESRACLGVENPLLPDHNNEFANGLGDPHLKFSSAPEGFLAQLSGYRKAIAAALMAALLSACQTTSPSLRRGETPNGVLSSSSPVNPENSPLPLALQNLVQNINMAVAAGEFPSSLSEKIIALIAELNGGWTEVQNRIMTDVFVAGKKIQTARQNGNADSKQHADSLLSLLVSACNSFNFKTLNDDRENDNNLLLRVLGVINNTNFFNSETSSSRTRTYSPPTRVEVIRESQQPAVLAPPLLAPATPPPPPAPVQPPAIPPAGSLTQPVTPPPVIAPPMPAPASPEVQGQDEARVQARKAALLEHLRRLGLLGNAAIIRGSVVPSRRGVGTAPRRFSPPARPANSIRRAEQQSQQQTAEKKETNDQVTRNPFFDRLWNSMESDPTIKDLKNKIIAAHRVPHRWRQLLFLAEKSDLDVTLFYLNIKNYESKKPLLAVFLLDTVNAYTSGYDTEPALPVLRNFLLHLERYQLRKSPRDYPSLANIKPSLGKLESKIEQGVNANPDHFVVVDISEQLLYLVRRFSQGRYSVQGTYPVSTAAKGVYQNTKRVIPEKTPLGAMRVTGLWGGASRLNQVYHGGAWRNKRVKIETVTDDDNADREMIAGIMPLQSLDPATPASGVYIHGTNKKSVLGLPDSAGCVSVSPAVSLMLLKILKSTTLVYIQR